MGTAEAGGDTPNANIKLIGDKQPAAMEFRRQGGRNPQDDLAARNLVLVSNSIADREQGRGCKQLLLKLGNRSHVGLDLAQDVRGYRGHCGIRDMIAVCLDIATAYGGLQSLRILAQARRKHNMSDHRQRGRKNFFSAIISPSDSSDRASTPAPRADSPRPSSRRSG